MALPAELDKDVQRIERELMASRKAEFDALPQFLGSRRCNVRGIPDEWVRQFKNIEEMDRGKFGAQMDGGWFATMLEHGDVFVKKFKREQTKEAELEIALYDILDGQSHMNVALPVLHTKHNSQILTVQEKLGGGDLFDHILRAHHELKKPYSEEEVRRMLRWACLGAQFLHMHGVAHRDLKSENVMGGVRSRYLKLVDFGTGLHFPEVQAKIEAAGSPAEVDNTLRSFIDPGSKYIDFASSMFSSPEHRRNGTACNPFACDVWSIGQTLYLMMAGRMPKDSSSAVKAQLRREKGFSPEVKDLIEKMTAPERTRFTFNEALLHPWLATQQSQTALPDEVLSGLLKLNQRQALVGKDGDYFVKEVGTQGSHIIPNHKFGISYKPRAMPINQLSAGMKAKLPNWREAEQEGMVFYESKELRDLVVINEAALATLCGNWRDLHASWQRGSVEVEDASKIPSNRAVFDFIQSRIDAGDANFAVQKFKKLGVFGRQMTADETVEVAKTEASQGGGQVFVYTSPWSTAVAHKHLQLQPGDALVYRAVHAEGPRVHTMEKAAIELNHECIQLNV